MQLRTWVEINKAALFHNVRQFLRLIPKQTFFMAVVKSNAYGHGLTQVAKLLANNQLLVTGNQKLWFGVDSIVEGLRLRNEGIKNPILVLGSTLQDRVGEAYQNNITLSVSNFDALMALSRVKEKPHIHIKIDTGMHRQGFLPHDVTKLITLIKNFKLSPSGIFTHFALAKDKFHPAHTLKQLSEFTKILLAFREAGFVHLVRHAAASGGTLLFPDTHLDLVRIGMGIYGYWPSEEVKEQKLKISLQPVLSWKTLVSEVKEIPAGSFVGYDLTEKVLRKTKIAILPVGYWHGYDRGLSGTGEVLVRGRRRKILGRISMDMIVVDCTDTPKVGVGDEAVLIGVQGKEAVWADKLALKICTNQYEFLTRINPLIKRIVV